jgi:hypothetical protein
VTDRRAAGGGPAAVNPAVVLAVAATGQVIATILASYHLYNYDLTLLLLPIAIVCGELAHRGSLLSNTVLRATLAVLFVPPLHLVLVEHSIYALMCAPVLALFFIVTRLIRVGEGPAGVSIAAQETPAGSISRGQQ